MLDLAVLIVELLVVLGSCLGHIFGAGVGLGIVDGDSWGPLRGSLDSGI